MTTSATQSCSIPILEYQTKRNDERLKASSKEIEESWWKITETDATSLKVHNCY
jgi:hypothetical protein